MERTSKNGKSSQIRSLFGTIAVRLFVVTLIVAVIEIRIRRPDLFGQALRSLVAAARWLGAF